MPRRIERPELLAEMEREFLTLETLLKRVDAADLVRSRVNRGGWSLKDVLAHVGDWADRCAGWCEAGLAGRTPEVPGPGYTWREFPALNREIYARHRDQSLPAVRRAFRRGHRRLHALATTLDAVALSEPRQFPWTGPTWAVANHIRANTASHYRWASKHVRRWLASATLGKKAPRARAT